MSSITSGDYAGYYLSKWYALPALASFTLNIIVFTIVTTGLNKRNPMFYDIKTHWQYFFVISAIILGSKFLMVWWAMKKADTAKECKAKHHGYRYLVNSATLNILIHLGVLLVQGIVGYYHWREYQHVQHLKDATSEMWDNGFPSLADMDETGLGDTGQLAYVKYFFRTFTFFWLAGVASLVVAAVDMRFAAILTATLMSRDKLVKRGTEGMSLFFQNLAISTVLGPFAWWAASLQDTVSKDKYSGGIRRYGEDNASMMMDSNIGAHDREPSNATLKSPDGDNIKLVRALLETGI